MSLKSPPPALNVHLLRYKILQVSHAVPSPAGLIPDC